MKFIDSIYGEIDLEIPSKILASPEIQRLREVRLCNVNSPFIPGGSNLNRFEHAIGTAFLAQEFSKINRLEEYEKRIFILSALLHDIVTAPFGHSFEYLIETLTNKKYQHANIRKMVFSGKTVPFSRNFFMEKKTRLSNILDQNTLNSILNILENKHYLSQFLSNIIDIDNIDNVFRFAYHIGISFNKDYPLCLAKNLSYRNNLLFIKPEIIPLFQEWFRVRSILYKYLLENPGEFVAKALLERCLIECIKDSLISEVDWILTDYDLIKLVITKGNKVAKNCMQRLMLMDFPKKYEIFVCYDYKGLDNTLHHRKIELIDTVFDSGAFLHFIRDVNKTKRVLKGITYSENSELPIQIGWQEDRYLIGIFSDKYSILKNNISLIKKEIDLPIYRLCNDGKQKSIINN